LERRRERHGVIEVRLRDLAATRHPRVTLANIARDCSDRLPGSQERARYLAANVASDSRDRDHGYLPV
jgi:hypothetical protein